MPIGLVTGGPPGTAERRRLGERLVEHAALLSDASLALARRVKDGGRLFVIGTGATEADASHVAVEFLHPVIVGKPAIAAVALSGDPAAAAAELRLLARPEDVVLVIADAVVPDELATAVADVSGCLRIALCTNPAGIDADHVVDVDTHDPLLAKEVFVTCYHLLWELTHVFLDQLGGRR